LTWEEVTRLAGSPEPIVEMTSVTGMVRRVAEFSNSEFKRACTVNRPTELALTFADYVDWQIHEQPRISKPVDEFIERVVELAECPVTLVNTGPTTTIDRDAYRSNLLRRIAA
jgi:adenylosuccinate synthase